MAVFTRIWFFLLVITAVEVFLAYVHTPLTVMLAALLGLSALKAGYIVAYFMHIKFESRRLRWLLFPAPVLLMLSLLALLPDAARGQCVMCQRNAAAQNEARRVALNKGIAIMAAPPLLLLGAIFWLASRRQA